MRPWHRMTCVKTLLPFEVADVERDIIHITKEVAHNSMLTDKNINVVNGGMVRHSDSLTLVFSLPYQKTCLLVWVSLVHC